MKGRAPWLKNDLVRIGSPGMPITGRVTCYPADIMALHVAGHAVLAAMADTLDASEIEGWIRKSDETNVRFTRIMRRIGQHPNDTTFPSPLG